MSSLVRCPDFRHVFFCKRLLVYIYQAPLCIKVPVEVDSIAVWIAGGYCVLSPETIFGIVQPGKLHTHRKKETYARQTYTPSHPPMQVTLTFLLEGRGMCGPLCYYRKHWTSTRQSLKARPMYILAGALTSPQL